MISVSDSLRLAAVEIPPVRWCYVQAMMLLARTYHRKGRWLKATEAALRAWRVNPEGFSAARRNWCRGVIDTSCYLDGTLGTVSENRLLAEYIQSAEAARIRDEFADYPVADRVRLRFPRPNDDPERQGDLIILKAPDHATGEKGVMLVKYSEAFRRLLAVFDLRAIAADYQVVLEPSWWGYQDATFLLYLGSDLDVVILAPRQSDFDFIAELGSNLVPVRLGAGDWVDGDTFQPVPRGDRDFDVVMVAGWSPMKRHATLFRALRTLRQDRARVLRTALVGYPQGWPRSRIEKLMHSYGVADQCTILEQIPHEHVARIVARARVSVVLSRREGANKALYESLFCDTPVILLHGQRGVNLDHITDDIGLLTDEPNLGEALLQVLDGVSHFRPREWALAHTGWRRSTETLNDLLREMAKRRGLPWAEDIAPKKNAPNLRYAVEGMYRRFEAHYQDLEGFLAF